MVIANCRIDVEFDIPETRVAVHNQLDLLDDEAIVLYPSLARKILCKEHDCTRHA